jgi:CBS domain-containing protein
MHVHDAMTTDICTVDAERPIVEAARLMTEKDIGALPVLERGRLVGMVTDRDIMVRAVAAGMSTGGLVRDIMTPDVQCCHPAEDVRQALDEMSEQKIRRMPVVSSEGELVGMISLSDILVIDDDFRSIGRTLRDICTPHGVHSQALI